MKLNEDFKKMFKELEKRDKEVRQTFFHPNTFCLLFNSKN